MWGAEKSQASCIKTFSAAHGGAASTGSGLDWNPCVSMLVVSLLAAGLPWDVLPLRGGVRLQARTMLSRNSVTWQYHGQTHLI